MYYTIFSSAFFALRMGRFYLTLFALSATLFFSSSASANDTDVPAANNNQCVVLLHGLARTYRSMEKMEQALSDAGYLTANIDYPSRTMKIQDLASMAVKEGVDSCRSQSASQINFVTHSMGGILARYYLAKNSHPQLARVVMLAPPNKGSLVTDQFRNEQWYKWVTGPAGQQLGTGKDGIPGLLGAVDYPTGIIAGDVHSPLDNWLAEIIPGEDDGKVSVGHAKVEGMSDFIVLPYTHISIEGMSDFIVLPYTHITIMRQNEVIRQTLYFLKKGRFDHPGKESVAAK